MQTVPCWLCGKPLDLKITKGGGSFIWCVIRMESNVSSGANKEWRG